MRENAMTFLVLNLKKVVYEPVSLKQEFRDFDNESPWEGMKETIQEELKK